MYQGASAFLLESCLKRKKIVKKNKMIWRNMESIYGFVQELMGAFVFNQGHQLTKALRMC
jgi:hypothetical protein